MVHPAGLEPATYGLRRPSLASTTDDSISICDDSIPDTRNNPSNEMQNVSPDGDLEQVITAWKDLPEAVKAGIVAMVQASKVLPKKQNDSGGKENSHGFVMTLFYMCHHNLSLPVSTVTDDAQASQGKQEHGCRFGYYSSRDNGHTSDTTTVNTA